MGRYFPSLSCLYLQITRSYASRTRFLASRLRICPRSVFPLLSRGSPTLRTRGYCDLAIEYSIVDRRFVLVSVLPVCRQKLSIILLFSKLNTIKFNIDDERVTFHLLLIDFLLFPLSRHVFLLLSLRVRFFFVRVLFNRSFGYYTSWPY
jgi:hypothetical protein